MGSLPSLSEVTLSLRVGRSTEQERRQKCMRSAELVAHTRVPRAVAGNTPGAGQAPICLHVLSVGFDLT